MKKIIFLLFTVWTAGCAWAQTAVPDLDGDEELVGVPDLNGDNLYTVGDVTLMTGYMKAGTGGYTRQDLDLLVRAVLYGTDRFYTTNPKYPDVKGTGIMSVYPENWKIVDGITYSIIDIQVTEDGVPNTISTDDMLAVFVGGECRGVVKRPVLSSEKLSFNLSLHLTQADAYSPEIVFELRYFSTKNQAVYTSQPVTYTGEEQLGMIGYTPTWK